MKGREEGEEGREEGEEGVGGGRRGGGRRERGEKEGGRENLRAAPKGRRETRGWEGGGKGWEGGETYPPVHPLISVQCPLASWLTSRLCQTCYVKVRVTKYVHINPNAHVHVP